MVDIDAAHNKKLAMPGEDKAINAQIEKCRRVYEQHGKKGLIAHCVRMFIEVRRLSIAVEAKNNELKELQK